MFAMNVDENTLSQDKKPSPELFEMIQAAASSLTGFAQLWESIRKKGNAEGFNDTQLQDFIKPLLKEQLNMSKEQIWYMFNKEQKAITNKEAYQRRINTPNVGKKDTGNNSIPPKPKEEQPKPKTEIPPSPPEENGLETENQFLKEQVTQLQDALKKTEQFTPASAQIERSDDFDEYGTNETKVFEWLGKRDNGVNCYWYPNYGIELFRNRILTQLKNKGVTTFKRLYFEV
jgi:hypothetical protein